MAQMHGVVLGLTVIPAREVGVHEQLAVESVGDAVVDWSALIWDPAKGRQAWYKLEIFISRLEDSLGGQTAAIAVSEEDAWGHALALEALGLEATARRKARQPATPPVLRHSYCTWLAQQGLSLFDVAGLARHESVETTQKYAHHSPHISRAGAEALEKLAKTTAKTTAKRAPGQKKRRPEAA